MNRIQNKEYSLEDEDQDTATDSIHQEFMEHRVRPEAPIQ